MLEFVNQISFTGVKRVCCGIGTATRVEGSAPGTIQLVFIAFAHRQSFSL